MTTSIRVDLEINFKGVNSTNGKRSKELCLEAIERYEAGESATIICRSLGKSRGWLYKWIQRKDELHLDPGPIRAHNRMPLEVEKAVIGVRKKLQSTKYAQIGVNALCAQLFEREHAKSGVAA